jgi:hypothetical protein
MEWGANGYRRTRIERVRLRGYRSISDLVLDDIPDLVVMHGPNGSGKSNILRAVRLALRVVGAEGGLAASREASVLYEQRDAADALGLRPFDFRNGVSEIRIGLIIHLGDRSHMAIDDGRLSGSERVHLEIVLQNIGQGRVLTWCDKAETDCHLPLLESAEAQPIRKAIRGLEANIVAQREQIQQRQDMMRAQPPRDAWVYRQTIRNLDNFIDQLKRQIASHRKSLGVEDLRAERVRDFIGKSTLQASEAYRRVDDLQAALFSAVVSPDRTQVEAVRRLSSRLPLAGLFGSTQKVDFRPVAADEAERHIFVNRPGVGELPLRNPEDSFDALDALESQGPSALYRVPWSLRSAVGGLRLAARGT